MKERPILMSTPMVRATLDSTKTQTRRAMMPQPSDVINQLFIWKDNATPKDDLLALCPYGQPGDRLWVREAWRAAGMWDSTPPRDLNPAAELVYEADGATSTGREQFLTMGKYRPPMFMPRWASRITLEIAAVRVERLQDISEYDARAEGADCLVFDNCTQAERDFLDMPLMESGNPYRSGFALLWESINGAGSWEANPWVWAVEFKRIKP